MTQFKTLMDVFKLLDKSNCRRCNRQTCMAFAADVFTGKAELNECPRVSPDICSEHSSGESLYKKREEDFFQIMQNLCKQIEKTDLETVQKRTGGMYNGSSLTLTCLGKPVIIEKTGKIKTDIHINPWVAIPLYNHLLHAKETSLSNSWVPFRELPNGMDWFRLFNQRCEKPLKKIADEFTDFFEDLIRLFKGEKVENHYESDISLVLHPFPAMPVLICYWKSEDAMDSDLNVFFDEKAEDKLPINSIFTMTAGLVNMFDKISRRHG